MRNFQRGQVYVGALLVNQQISEEALSTLYSTTVFHFDDMESLIGFVMATPDTHLAMIASLILTITLSPSDKIPGTWLYYLSTSVLGKMRALKVFEVSVWAIYSNPHHRVSMCYGDFKMSPALPCLKRGSVTFIGDKPLQSRTSEGTWHIRPPGFGLDIADLIEGRTRR